MTPYEIVRELQKKMEYYSSKELATKSGLCVDTVCRIRRTGWKKTHLPKLPTIYKLCMAMNLEHIIKEIEQ